MRFAAEKKMIIEVPVREPVIEIDSQIVLDRCIVKLY